MSNLTVKSFALAEPAATGEVGSREKRSIAVKHTQLISLCYQLFLGRLPEDNKIILARTNQSLEDLIRELVKSDEFRDWAKSNRFREKTVFSHVIQKNIGELLCLLDIEGTLDQEATKIQSCQALVDNILLDGQIVTSDPLLTSIRAEYFSSRCLNTKESLPESVLLDKRSKEVIESFFDVSYYSKVVRKKFESPTNALEHYLSLEIGARKNPSHFFNRDLYLALYPVVKTLNFDPLIHYVCIGRFKNYRPHPIFDMQSTNTDLVSTTVSSDIYLEFLSEADRFSNVQFHPLIDVDYVRKQLGRNAHSQEIFLLFSDPNAKLSINPTPLFDIDFYQSTGGCITYKNALIEYVIARPNQARVHPLFDDVYYTMSVGNELGGQPPLQHYIQNWHTFSGDVNLLIDSKHLNHQLRNNCQSGIKPSCEPLGYLLQHRVDFIGPLFHPHVDTRVIEAAFGNLLSDVSPQGEQLTRVLLSLVKFTNLSRGMNASAPTVSVIILNYYKPVYSAVCMMAVLNAFREVNIEIVFVENGGDSFHFEFLTKIFSGSCKFVPKKLVSNKYFGEANNIGVDLASGANVLFLNNDCFLMPDFGAAAVSLIREGGHDAVGALLMYPDGTIQEFGGLVADDGQVIQRAKGVPAEFLHSATIDTVEYTSAACFLISRSALDVVVGFDPMFEPFYYEDTDLCRRLRSAGLTLSVSSKLKAIHIENASTREYLEESKFQKMVGDHRSLYARRWLKNSGVGAYTHKLGITPEVNSGMPCPTAVIYTPFGIRPGGGERYVFSAARALSKTHRILICSPEFFSKARVKFLLNSLNIDQFEFEVCELSRLAISAPHIDIWFVMANEVVTSMPARGRVNIYHLQFPFPWRNTNAFQFDLLSSYGVIIVNSEFTRYWTKQRLAEIGIVGTPPVEIVYPPVKSLSRPGVVRRSDTLQVVTIGRFFVGGHSKRQDVFIQILQRARKLTSRRISAVILGSVHASVEAQNYFECIKALAEGVGGVQVITEASNEEIVEHLGAADVYLHCTGYGVAEAVWPEKAEHFGITIIEAIRSGCVPLAYGIGGPAEIIQHSKAGLTFKSIDEAAGLLAQVCDHEYRTKLLNAVDWRWVDQTSEAAFDERLLSIVQSFDPVYVEDHTTSKHGS